MENKSHQSIVQMPEGNKIKIKIKIALANTRSVWQQIAAVPPEGEKRGLEALTCMYRFGKPIHIGILWRRAWDSKPPRYAIPALIAGSLQRSKFSPCSLRFLLQSSPLIPCRSDTPPVVWLLYPAPAMCNFSTYRLSLCPSPCQSR